MVNQGEDRITKNHTANQSLRKPCKVCGGHVLIDHPEMGLVDVYAAMLRALPFQPGLRVHHGEKVLGIPDGLPIFADLPGKLGGSGQVLPD